MIPAVLDGRDGNEHFARKDFLDAIRCYTEAIDIDGSNHVLYGNRRWAHPLLES